MTPPPLDPERHALLLDFDGTLVEFAPRPDHVRLRPGAAERLDALRRRLGGALALVSGRKVEALDRFTSPYRFNAIGVHGHEIRPAGEELRLRPTSPQLDVARRRLAAELGGGDRLRLEDKGSALVLHFREHPEEAERAAQLGRRAVDGLADLHAVPGNMIVELRERGVSKADAVALVAGWPGFAGRLPVFVGDDTTDEDGFRAAAAAGGFGIKVGPGPTAAPHRLPDVAAVHTWLADV
jgi:trehalose 6-phosphate phosphatase